MTEVRRLYFDGDRALVPLAGGAVAQIDVEDAGLVSNRNWCLYYGYAYSAAGLMHRLLTSAPTGYQVDHANGDTLDNRRANLRICTQTENRRNSRGWSTSGYKGVYPLGSRWKAQIKFQGQTKHLGMFATPEEAARAYDAAARNHFGAFARCNFKV